MWTHHCTLYWHDPSCSPCKPQWQLTNASFTSCTIHSATFQLGLLVHSLGHSQHFRWHLLEPAAIHTQWCSQNLAKHVPPSFYCGNIVVLVIVLYCITTATVSCLIHPIAGMTSHMTHCATQLSSQVACLYSLLISCSTSPLMCAHFYLQMTMSCSLWENDHIAHMWHSILYLIGVLTLWKASNILPLNSKSKSLPLKNLDKFHLLQLTHLALHTPLAALCTSPCAMQFALRSLFTLWLCSLSISPPSYLSFLSFIKPP